MKKAAIVGLTMLLNVVALAQIPSDITLGIEITNRSKTGISGVVSNTQEDVLLNFNINKAPQIGSRWVSLMVLK